MRVRTKLSLVLSPFLVVVGFCVAARFACGCADIRYVPSAVEELPPDVLAAARRASPGAVFTRAVKLVEKRSHVLQSRLEGRDASGATVAVVVFADLRTQVDDPPDGPRLAPLDPPADPSPAGR